MPKYVDAEALAERFRDMAEFADGIQAVALREAADAAEDMPEADVRQVLSGEWQVVRGYFRFLRCPFCGYETENEKQPKKDGWKFCPGCGNKCSEGGQSTAQNNRRKVVYVPQPGENLYRNGENYKDPTAGAAILNIEKGAKNRDG